MKKKLHTKAKAFRDNPKLKEAVTSMKPDKTIWGFLGVTLFFILPEIIAFIWGVEITAYAKTSLSADPGWLEYYYKGLVMLFEEGGSWVNLIIGCLFLIWLFF
jgi:hypothetical protein